MDKILIGIVTYDGKSYCFKKFAAFLKSITYPKIDIVFVDNSRTTKNRDMIQKAGFNVEWLRKGNAEQEIMANCNEWLRQYALQYQFSHLLSLESDIFPCPDFLEFMLAYEKQVVGLPYFIGSSFMSYLLQFDQEKIGFNRQLIPMSNAKSFFLSNGKLRHALQIGLGCLLMHNSVLKRVRFTIDLENPLYHADSSLHLQLQQLNIPVYLCPEYVCEHQNKIHNILYIHEEHERAGKYKDFAGNNA
jgi:GT2 family glycosyltransferase